MIRVRCRWPEQPSDEERWPSMFATLPRSGEFVESNTGRRLRVVRVTHLSVTRSTEAGEMLPPFIELELGQ